MATGKGSIQELLRALDRGEPHMVEVVTISEKKGFVQLKLEDPARSVVVTTEVYDRIKDHLHENHPELRNTEEPDDTYVPDPDAQAERSRRRQQESFRGYGDRHGSQSSYGQRSGEEGSRERYRIPERGSRDQEKSARNNDRARNSDRARDQERHDREKEPVRTTRGAHRDTRREHTGPDTGRRGGREQLRQGTRSESTGARTGNRGGSRPRESRRRNTVGNHTNG